MENHVYVPAEVKKEMQTTFKVNKVSLFNALNFRSNSPKAKMLRAAAYQRGGVHYPAKELDFETYFITAENLMVQNFGNRVKLVADLSTGLVCVYSDNVEFKRFNNPTLNELASIQQLAQGIADNKNK